MEMEKSMKRAKIIDIFSPNIDDLSSYKPDDPENFCILLQISVGIAGSQQQPESGETFDIEVYTPKWLLSKYQKDEAIFPKNSLIVFEFDFDRIKKRIRKEVENCTGESWNEIANKISTFSAWEFEGYDE